MSGFDWQKFLLNDLPLTFLGEVAVRVCIAYVVVFTFLKISGRRGVQQLSLFEVVIILTLGSASGDVTFYDDVPVLPVIMVFVVLLGLYRATTWCMSHFPPIGRLIEGEVITLVAEGRYVVENLDRLNISENEFLMELRRKGIIHLGQVRLALVEVDGQLSTYCYEKHDIRPGLSVLPPEHRDTFTSIMSVGLYACTHCGHVDILNENNSTRCIRCNKMSWSYALTHRHIG
ncbi:YetF domain-containing protein (plasmid) [Erwinia persicina]|uniref:YetF domain-containing protein n=1 Tax=Erwinia persicina TaxID=55211 RepID=UPI0030D43D09